MSFYKIVFKPFLWKQDSLVNLSDLFILQGSCDSHEFGLVGGSHVIPGIQKFFQKTKSMRLSTGFEYKRRKPSDKVGSHLTSPNIGLTVINTVLVILEL